MACAIVAGYALDCKDSVGGIKNIYLTELANITAVSESASGYITAITKAGGTKFWKYALEPQGANSATDNINTDPKIGTVSYNQTVSVSFLGVRFETSFKLQQIIKNRTMIIVEGKSGKFFLYGKENGMEVSGGTAALGAAMNEFNGYTIPFTGMEKMFAQEVDPSIITALQS